MNLQNAVSLINHPAVAANGITNWADLGCGNGLFSIALASLLKPGSNVYAVDKTPGITDDRTSDGVHLIVRKFDFLSDEPDLPQLDGILMANSLHYVKDKIKFINQIKDILKPDGKFIIVEYNTDRSNRWVPYPLPFSELPALFLHAGFTSVELINSVPSVYRDSNIYGCIISH
jgi:SAM-dependent methyltransferase